MSKVVTLRLDDSTYDLFRYLAQQANRPISNFIETATLERIRELEFADEFEMAEIQSNATLKKEIREGVQDAHKQRGRFL